METHMIDTNSESLDQSKKKFAQYVKDLQQAIVKQMKKYDPSLNVIEDRWQREDHQGAAGGGGLTMAMTGDLFENAGVNTSEIFGAIDPRFSSQLAGSGDQLWATGISLILHPRNPRVPTVHANFRFIHQGDRWWFGGGADLTPYYPYPEDFRDFHQTWKKACAPYGVYEKFKAECDEYFSNHHRLNSQGKKEMRGIGGIFYDHFNSGDLSHDLAMSMHLGDHFIESYFPLVDRRYQETWNSSDEEFMLIRHGRYTEFNLLHDRGTLFGLKTNGRVDSILISLPARCHYQYRYQPAAGSLYEKMWGYYYPQNWA